MRVEWDPAKDRANRVKHGLTFREAADLLASDVDCFEIYDGAHSQHEDRFIALGPTGRGVIVVVYTVRHADVIRILSARVATRKERDLFMARWRGNHG